jgi:hypothetical protein
MNKKYVAFVLIVLTGPTLGADQTNIELYVDAGPDHVVTLSGPVILPGIVSTSTGISSGTGMGWAKLSGPGSAMFTNSHSAETTATFDKVGEYGLALFAFLAYPGGGYRYAWDTVTISVTNEPTPKLPFTLGHANNFTPGSITDGFFISRLTPSGSRQNAMRIYRGMGSGSNFLAKIKIAIPLDWKSVPDHCVMVMVMHPTIGGPNYWRVYLRDTPELHWYFLSNEGGTATAPAIRGEEYEFYIQHLMSDTGHVEISIDTPLLGTSGCPNGQFVCRTHVQLYEDAQNTEGVDRPYFGVGLDTSAFPLTETRELFYSVGMMGF